MSLRSESEIRTEEKRIIIIIIIIRRNTIRTFLWKERP